MENAKIDRKLNLVLPINMVAGHTIHLYVPQPTKLLFNSISKVLSKFYSLALKDIPIDVVIIDYEQYIDEAIEGMPNRDEYLTKVKSFLEKVLLGSHVYDTSSGEFSGFTEYSEKLTEDDRGVVEGMLLFICALFRYTSQQIKTSLLGDYFTSLTYSEWMKHCEKVFKESKADTK